MDVEVLIQREDGSSQVQRFPIDGSPLSIGRTPQCSVHLPSDLVSRLHALVYVDEGGLRVEDRSSNGTIVGDVLLRRQTLAVPFGTLFVVGEYTLSVGPPGTIGSVAPPSDAGFDSMPPHNPMAATGMNPALRPERWDAPTGALEPRAMREAILARPRTQPAPKSTRPAGRVDLRSPVTNPAREKEMRTRREIHDKLLENLDLAKLDAAKLDDPSMRPRVLTALRRIVQQMDGRIDPSIDRNALVGELADEALGLGPLERYLEDPMITEVMVVDPDTIYIETEGRLIKTDGRFTDDERVRAVIERIITPLGRRIDESSPLVDARLRDGSRVNAIIRPLALRGTCITIRKFARVPLDVNRLIELGSLTAAMARFLARCVIARKNILISGGTGSGKTTLLNVLSAFIPEDERIVTIEDAAELQLPQPHVVPLESRPPNMEGRGEYTIRDLVRNALRMRPDRIVVGECRGGEALDMLQAMNTGHDGSLTTTHANSPEEALARLETLALMAGIDLPSRAIREQLSTSIHVVVQVVRLSDGTRLISDIGEVVGLDRDGSLEMRPIFEFVRLGTGEEGKVLGEHRATGYLPTFLGEFIVRNLVRRGEPYL